MTAAICLIVKNEVRDIAEWVAHHINIGADKLIIYDNNSDDGTFERLNELAKHFPIDVIPWPDRERNNQLRAYEDCLQKYRDEFDWIGFIDTDEFIIPPPGRRLSDLFLRHKDRDAFSLNWLVFGSSGIGDTNGRFVMESFTHRSDVSSGVNRPVKTFVRPAKVQKVAGQHYFNVPGSYADVMGNPIEWEAPGLLKVGGAFLGDFRLHHYVTRSEAHWKRRVARGQPTSPTRTPAFFIRHDQNEILDEAAVPYANQARALLASKGLTESKPQGAVSLMKSPMTTIPFAPTILFHLDEFTPHCFRGWSLDEVSNSNSPLVLRILVDGDERFRVTCDRFRKDVELLGHKGISGFNYTFPETLSRTLFDGKEHNLTVQTLDGRGVIIDMGHRQLLEQTFTYGPQSMASSPLPEQGKVLARQAEPVKQSPVVAPPPVTHADDIVLYLDILSSNGTTGWAGNKSDLSKPVQLRVFVDGKPQAILVDTKEQTQIVCDQSRPDVVAAKAFASPAVGFSFAFNRSVFDGNPHELTFQTLDGQNVEINHDAKKFKSLEFSGKWQPAIKSHVDKMHEGVLKGWVLRDNGEGKFVGGTTVSLYCDGVFMGHANANRQRPDVGKMYSADPKCGFAFEVPVEFRNGYTQKFSIVASPYDIELNGSPFNTTILGDAHEVKMSEITRELDRAYRIIEKARAMARTMVKPRHYGLENYDAWTLKYFPALRDRTAAERHASARSAMPVADDKIGVSVICPIYRPNMMDFTQAVESVIAQTYQNWELILIDDGSEMPELTHQIRSFAKRDSRIRVIEQKKNSGIASATNAGLKAVRGKRVAFFDHDDLLVDVALEVMVRQAEMSGALMLYSDEDKINVSGDYSEPALKPDWNYRMMLSANYVCHLVMVDSAVLKKAKGLSALHNGAQDHEFLLRLSEVIPAERIRHVPEILYHWRISETSTAGSTEAKPYAIQAGKAAIESHLQRRGIETARAESIHNTTWYRIDWGFTESPKVRIIIPFKDNIGITSECLARIIGGTDYQNYEVTLVDNWSVTPEAKKFCAEAVLDPRVHVIRVEEPFNYSRLNNIAARGSDAEYFVLMNNDLLVRDSSWLRTLVNEALADKDVGIVGGKFIYPNGAVQHAGVVTGIGGVAAHVHSGIGENDPGYGARALFAQEMSAVTAACLLIDSKLYWDVGGLDEKNLRVAFNDVDLCLNVREKGRKVIWTPDFIAEHHESLSRGDDDQPHKEGRFFDELDFMRKKWGKKLAQDPFYHPLWNLATNGAYDQLINPDDLAAVTREIQFSGALRPTSPVRAVGLAIRKPK